MKISKQLKFGLIISIILILSVAIISIISISNLDNKNITGKIIKENSKYETINIGAILPLTGNAAEFGLWMKQGLQLAVENTNDDKINNKKIKIFFEDSQSDVKTGLSAYKKLKEINKIDYLFTSISSVTIPILGESTKDNVLVLTSSTHSKINSKEYLVLRIYLTPEKTSQKMAEFAYNKLNKKRAGIIYLNDESLSEYEKYFSTTFENLGGKTYSENFNYGETDFKTQLTKIKQWAPDCLYICGWDENGLIMKQAKELGLDVQYLGTMTFNSEDTIKNARSAAENAIFAEFAFNPDTKNENMKEFKQKYIQKYNKEPTSTTALFYDGMKILIETINEANTKDPKKVFETIINKDQYSSTTIEDISFDSNGDIILPITFKIIQNSQFVDYK